MNAIIFAAGLGTRLRPLTDNRPKALVEVGGKPMLEHVILRLKNAGFRHIVVNIHHFGQQILDFLEANRNFDMKIEVSDERDCLLDTGGGIKKAAAFFEAGTPFLVHNVDIMSNLNLADFYRSHCRSSSQASLLVARRETSRYLLFDGENCLRGWENRTTGEVKSPFPDFHPADFTPYAFGGIHMISPELLSLMRDWSGKFSIIDFYLSIAAKARIAACPAPEGLQWIDVGKPTTLREAEEKMAGSGF